MEQSRRRRHILLRIRDLIRARDTSDLAVKLRNLRRSTFPAQRDAYDDPSVRMSTRVGRGGGKTTCIKARQIKRGIKKRGSQLLYFATTKEQAERLMWGQMKQLLEQLELEYKEKQSKLQLWVPRTDTLIQLAGAPDKRAIEIWRGDSWDGVDVDECGSHSKNILEHLVYRVISPRLGDKDGYLALWGTPSPIPKGVFYDTSRPGSPMSRPYKERANPDFADWDGWSTHHWYLLDGVDYVPALAKLWQEALREKRRNKWSDSHPVWRREYLAEWASDDSETIFKYRPHLDDGLEWNQWSPQKNKRGVAILPNDREWFYVYGMDSGTDDPFALEVFAFSPTEGKLRHVYEYVRKGMYANKIAELLLGPKLDVHNPTGLIKDTGWPDAIVGDMPPSLIEELSKVYGIQVNEAKRRHKFGAIENFNGELVDGRIIVMKDSTLEEQLMHLQWAVNEHGERKEPKSERNDAADAAVYGREVASHQFIQEPEPDKPARGTRERDELDAREAEERAARGGDGEEFESILFNETYDFLK